MADEKTVDLRIDASQGAQALDQLENAAEGASDAMGQLAVAVDKTEQNVKKIVTASRDYNSAARAVGDSVQAITRFEAAYKASLTDTANSAQVRASILEASAKRTIGGAIDEARATDLMVAGHAKAAEAVQFIVQQQAALVASIRDTAQADSVAASVVASNANIRVEAIRKAAEAARVAALPVDRGYLDGMAPLANKSAGASAGVFAAAFREEESAAKAAALALVNHERALNENIRIAAQWEAMLDAEARAAREAAAAVEKKAQRNQALVSTYAPAIVKAEQLAQAERELTALIAAGAGPIPAYTSALAGVKAEQAALALESQHAARGFSNVGMVAQQAGYQIADVAAVAAAGGSAMAAAGTQLGQFLGVFGPMGAMAGAAVTVLGLLATNMIKTGDATLSAADAQKQFNEATREGIELQRSESEVAAMKAGDARERALALRTEAYATQQLALARANASLVANTGALGEQVNEGVAERANAAAAAARANIAQLQQEIDGLVFKNPQATGIARDLSSAKPKLELEGKRDAVQAGIDEAVSNGDEAEVKRLTDTYGDLNRAISTYKTEGEKAVLVAEAQAKAASMGAVEGQRYLAQRQAEIGLMGKVIEQGEAEKTISAARIEANSAAAKSYSDSSKAIAAASIQTQAALAIGGIEADRQALAQRRALGEISAAEELAQLAAIEDRKRAVEMAAAQQKLAHMRKTEADNLTGIAAAENAVTELRAKHSLDRQKQINDEAAARQKAARDIAAIEAEGTAALGNAGISAKTETVGFQKSMGDISGSEEITALRAIAEEKYQIELDLLNKKLQLAGAEEAERARINQQIVMLDEKRSADMMRLSRQESLNRLQDVRGLTAPFTQATAQMTQGFIQGTLTRQQLAGRAAQSIALSYAQMGTKVAADWFNKNVLMAAYDRVFGAQKIATAGAVETAKTGATATGSATRAAIGQTENAGFFSRIGAQIAQWLGLETSKTAQTVVGASARTTAEATAATAAIFAAKAAALSEIPAYAGIGAAAAMASVAAIPFVGWAMAPGVGAAHAAMAMGYLGLASAEGGWGEVPEDGVRTELHKKEMVLPAQFAIPLRAMLTGGGLPGMPSFAGPQIGGPAVPRYGLPGFLGRPIGGESAERPQPVVSKGDVYNVSVAPTYSAVDSKGMKDLIAENSKEIAKAVKKEIRHFSPNAPRKG